MSEEIWGDRICPGCEMESLVECSMTKWKCNNPDCGQIYDEEWLDLAEIDE